MKLILVRVLVILEEDLDLVVHLFADIFAADTSYTEKLVLWSAI